MGKCSERIVSHFANYIGTEKTDSERGTDDEATSSTTIARRSPRSNGAEYNFKHVDQPPWPQREGISAFALEDGTVHHTYSSYDRGVEQLMGTFRYLDVAPLGRDDEGAVAGWWRRHDEYGTEAAR